MKPDEIAKAVAKCASVSERTAKKCVECYLSIITDEVFNENDFSLGDIGRLRVTTSKARAVMHPVTGKSIKIKARKVITFKASESMKTRLRNN